MSTDLPTQRPADGSPQYVADIEVALAIAAAAGPRPTPPPVVPAPPVPHPAIWAAVWRGVRSGALTAAALAGLVVFSVQGAAAVVDWWAPTAGPSACSEVVLPLVLLVLAIAVVGLAGAIVREIAEARARRPT